MRKYSFQQLGEEQGLAQNFVYGLVQDERGFLWMGTGQGLSRYDGFEIKNFFVKDSLSADFITSDYRAANGDLIFGHNFGGVSLYDGIQFRPLLPDTLGNKIVGIAEDRDGNIWVATQSKGLIFLNRNMEDVSMVLPEELHGQIINVLFAGAGLLWVGTNDGLFLYRMDGSGLTLVESDLLPPYAGVTSLLSHSQDSDLIWLGTSQHGVFLLQNDGRFKFSIRNRVQLPDLKADAIQAMAQDSEGDLWLGTRQHGVMRLNIGRDRKSVFKVDYFRKTTGFPVSSVNKLIVDRQGQVWISTMGDGVVRLYKDLFTYFGFAGYGVKEVRAIAETQKGYLVATDVGLLVISFNTQSDEYAVEPYPGMPKESVLSVYADKLKNIWVATENRGVYIFVPESPELKRVVIDPANQPVEVRLFEEDLNGNIWMSARGQGVYVVNPERKVIRHLTTANRFIHNDIFAIKADSKGNIWFGTYGAGLAMMNTQGELQLFSKQETLRAKDVNDIDEDAEGNIWIATEGEGFFKYADQKFTQVGTSESLVSPFIKGIKHDPTGRIWFSYRKGVGYYDLQSHKKYHFSRQDGLLATEAYSSAIIVDSKSNKWFCNDYGVTLFEHDTIANKRKDLVTYLTGIRIFFKDFPADLRNENKSMATSAGQLPPLQLTHEQNHITFDFVAIKLSRAGKVYYRHWLEGYDEDWTPPKMANFVTYTNLDPGKYVLKIQATDDLSTWVDPVTEYAFEIAPPYWRRTWFYLLQIFSVVALFGLTYLSGKRGTVRKRFVVRLMLFSSFFITLEYVENFIDPLISDSFGGAPVVRFFLNFILALLLLPIETIISHWMMERQKDLTKKPDPQPAKDTVAEEMLEEK